MDEKKREEIDRFTEEFRRQLVTTVVQMRVPIDKIPKTTLDIMANAAYTCYLMRMGKK